MAGESVDFRDLAASHAKLVLTDLWHALRTERKVQFMLILLVVSLVCWEMPGVSLLLYPFKLFVTTIHEACHALAARFTGGNVASISIAPDESGLTLSLGGFRPLVIMAGYLGSSIFGGALIWWGRDPQQAKTVLHSIGTVILALTIFYGGGGLFSFLAMLLIGAALILISRKASDHMCHVFLLVLAVQTTLNALVNIQDLFLISVTTGGKSDAMSMQEISGIPAAVWSVIWGLISIAVLLFAVWISYRRPRSKEPEA